MPKRKSTGPTNRDLGISGGSNGKGDKTRVTDPKAYASNYDQIDWGRGRKGVFFSGLNIPSPLEAIKASIANRYNRTVDNDYSGV